jgi:hypothetical protein
MLLNALMTPMMYPIPIENNSLIGLIAEDFLTMT